MSLRKRYFPRFLREAPGLYIHARYRLKIAGYRANYRGEGSLDEKRQARRSRIEIACHAPVNDPGLRSGVCLE